MIGSQATERSWTTSAQTKGPNKGDKSIIVCGSGWKTSASRYPLRIEAYARPARRTSTLAAKGERGDLRRSIEMAHVGIGPGMERGLDYFREVAVVVEVEAHAANDKRREEQQSHGAAGRIVPEDKGGKTRDRHDTGIDDRQPGDGAIVDDLGPNKGPKQRG